MTCYTPHQARYFAEQIALNRSEADVNGLIPSMSGAKIDLNPHQVEAAVFALKSPFSKGVLLADEVGLGKTIEAGLVLAQYWSERKRRILLIAPASLRMQWRAELSDKFFIDSVIMEKSFFDKAKRQGKQNPFDVENHVVICSYPFAASKEAELHQIPWDLVIMDEAHNMRNVFQGESKSKRANVIKRALSDVRKKLLLTATPLQNNLMELYGLASMIDDHIFGDKKVFSANYEYLDDDVLLQSLRDRLQKFCKRTLRADAKYVNYTNRIAICEKYEPSNDEEQLYCDISEYLQRERIYAIPVGKKNQLITIIMRKMLASSSFAISGTLDKLIARLEGILQLAEDYANEDALKNDNDLKLDDYDNWSEYSEEMENTNDSLSTADLKPAEELREMKAELELLRGFAANAKRITFNAKGAKLLTALENGFAKMSELGGLRKAVIFTESKRTQNYLFNLLSDNGYKGKVVFLNGDNDDCVSKAIYEAWKERHQDDGKVSGAKTADMKAAVVEAFKNEASILIGTEAASEGINLQFCSLVVNYDLPWNPQRIEQRIGRCHRYGQNFDVVVINFLNANNAADQRVYELLDEKFHLFNTVFGASDEVLGTLESGVDFEKRIADIYQKCRTPEEIQQAFDELQAQLGDKIEAKLKNARKALLETFDEDVSGRFQECVANTQHSLDNFQQLMFDFMLALGAEPLNDKEGQSLRLKYTGEEGKPVIYNLNWQAVDNTTGEHFLRSGDPVIQRLLQTVLQAPLEMSHIRFDNTGSPRRISFFDEHVGLKGVLSVDKLSYKGISEEEHLVFTVVTEDGTDLDDELLCKMLELPGTVAGSSSEEPAGLAELRKQHLDAKQEEIERNNNQYYAEERNKIRTYAEERTQAMQREIEEMGRKIQEKKRESEKSSAFLTLKEQIALEDELDKLVAERSKRIREQSSREQEIEEESKRSRRAIEKQLLDGTFDRKNVLTISFEIV